MPIVYPDESGRPSAMEYRIVFTAREPWLAILHLRQTDQEYASPVASAAVRDVVLNRVLENDLRSAPRTQSADRRRRTHRGAARRIVKFRASAQLQARVERDDA
ncbi:hypothetical protein VSR34_35200 [Paraburkholderia sp. JHI2823]|uniref:hypothetical protein n=1 Tax=Paraburkholderia sp. JHI2823 TaxID=3112960 RepID=UPI003182AE3D